MPDRVEILNGDHHVDGKGNLPFVIIDRTGVHVDLTGIGQLWDAPTVARIDWGLRDVSGKVFGRVTLKNGTSRNFFDVELMAPYLNAYYQERERQGLGEAHPFLRKVRPTQIHA